MDNESYDAGYDSGYDAGYSAGRDEGYDSGYDAGYASGHDDAEDEARETIDRLTILDSQRDAAIDFYLAAHSMDEIAERREMALITNAKSDAMKMRGEND